jgi:D-methionine transport system substrate-binding protein
MLTSFSRLLRCGPHHRPGRVGWQGIVAALLLTLLAAATPAGAADARRTAIVLGATAGPYADQIRLGIKPILEKHGYTVKVVEFHDYVQPNLALAQKALDANVFQNRVFLKRFAEDHKLDLAPIVAVPTVPMAVYSKRHKSLNEVGRGTTVALPNDPTNQARALTILSRIGWIKLKPGTDPLRVSERDVAENVKQIKLVPLEAAQLPRALEDTDYALINGNFAIGAGLKLKDAVKIEDDIETYMIYVTVRAEDRDAQFARDIVAAYRSAEFGALVNTRFPDYVKPKP